MKDLAEDYRKAWEEIDRLGKRSTGQEADIPIEHTVFLLTQTQAHPPFLRSTPEVFERRMRDVRQTALEYDMIAAPGVEPTERQRGIESELRRIETLHAAYYSTATERETSPRRE